MTTVALLGATGNAGRAVLRHLVSMEQIQEIRTFNRRTVDLGDLPKLSHHQVDMGSAEALEAGCAPHLRGVDAAISAMGIGSGKGSLEQFRRVDVELPTAFARAAVDAGVKRGVLLTAAGADIEKRYSWVSRSIAEGQYFHLKGLVEKNYADAGFPEGVVIFRPGGLLGNSHHPAWQERLLPWIDWMFPQKFRSIHTEQLAFAMAQAALSPPGSKVSIYEGQGLFERLPGATRTRATF